MKWGSICCLLLFSALLLFGCGESETAKEIRKVRKAGDLQYSYDIAVVSLAASSDQMDVWREYIYTVLELSRNADDEHDAFKYLAQSALMCAALNKYEGELSDKWEAAATLTRGQIVGQSRKVLGHIVKSRDRYEDDTEPIIESNVHNEFIDTLLDRARDNYEMNSLKRQSSGLVDPALARSVVWHAGCYYEMLNLLAPADSATTKLSMKIVDEQLNAWPTFSELDPSFITDIREEARKDLMSVYNSLVSDLEEYDYFTAEHVLKMELRP
jgi:hypothetical protein